MFWTHLKTNCPFLGNSTHLEASRCRTPVSGCKKRRPEDGYVAMALWGRACFELFFSWLCHDICSTESGLMSFRMVLQVQWQRSQPRLFWGRTIQHDGFEHYEGLTQIGPFRGPEWLCLVLRVPFLGWFTEKPTGHYLFRDQPK